MKTINNIISQLIIHEGWVRTYLMMGIKPQELAETLLNNDPINFLNIFNNLEIRPSVLIPGHIYYQDEKRKLILRHIDDVIFVRPSILIPLKEGFKLTNETINDILLKWLKDTYNINPRQIIDLFDYNIPEV
jgi:hypothetical protein